MENILQATKTSTPCTRTTTTWRRASSQAIRNAGREDEMFLTGAGGSQDAMKQIEEGGLYRATFLYNPNMAGTAVNMARLIALGQGFDELVPPKCHARWSCRRRCHERERRSVQEVRLQLSVPESPPDAPSVRRAVRSAQWPTTRSSRSAYANWSPISPD